MPTNLTAAAANLVSVITNGTSLSINLPTQGTNVPGDSTNALSAAPANAAVPDWGSVIALMIIGVAIGSIGSFCYQRVIVQGDKAKDKWELPKLAGMGAAAVALVPAFLRTISSNLVKDTATGLEPKLVFVAFCVAATLAAKRLIGTLPEKLLNLAQQAAEQTAQKEVQKVAEAVANRLPSTAKEPPTEHTSRNAAGPVVTGYDWKGLAVVRALLNPRYPQGRTVAGTAFDTGLTPPDVQHCLTQLQGNGDAAVFTGNPAKGPIWYLTIAGRQKLGILGTPGAEADIGIQ
jgi:hypothetical protein